MTTTITTPPAEANSATPAVYVPQIFIPLIIEQDIGNQVHPLLNAPSLRGAVDITFRFPTPRRGTLEMLFTSFTEANNCARAHGRMGTYTLADDVEFVWNMTYVPRPGRIRIEPDKVAGWWVSIDFQELP